MKTMCMRKGCASDAHWQIGFQVWASATSQCRDDNCISGLFGICVCHAHRSATNKDDLFTPAGKEMIGNMVVAQGKYPPDFTTAVLTWHAIVDKPIDPAALARAGGAP